MQQYGGRYSRFHGADSFDIVDSNTVRIPLADVPLRRDGILKMANFDRVRIECDRPLSRALRCFFNVYGSATIFRQDADRTWCELLGNQLVVFPAFQGKTYLCATEFFVRARNVSRLVKALGLVALDGDDIYAYGQLGSAVVFFDRFDVPYPGGDYFDAEPVPDFLRVCYLTGSRGDVAVPTQIRQHAADVATVHKMKTRAVEAVFSPYLCLGTPRSIRFPDRHYVKSGIVRKDKCYTDPNYVVQDVLDTRSDYDNLGLIFEFPVTVTYEYDDVETPLNRQYVGLAVNCSLPHRCLQMSRPYDRFYEYDKVPADVVWTTVLYDRAAADDVRHPTVVWNGNVLGYWIDQTFFCLSNVKLGNQPYVRFRNPAKVFDPVAFDLHTNDAVTVRNSYTLEGGLTLHRVKHRDIRYELWCFERREDVIVSKKAARVYPPLVAAWIDLIASVGEPRGDFGDTRLVRFMYVLARHGACFSTRKSSDRKMAFEGDNKVVFYVEEEVRDVVNDVRFFLEDKNGAEAPPNCTVS